MRDAPLAVYWGDLDVDGLSILSQFRAAGVPAVSMLMDLDTYAEYSQIGTSTDKDGKPLCAEPGPVPEHLHDGEARLYARLASDAPVLRVEHDRIPLLVALTRRNMLRDGGREDNAGEQHDGTPQGWSGRSPEGGVDWRRLTRAGAAGGAVRASRVCCGVLPVPAPDKILT